MPTGCCCPRLSAARVYESSGSAGGAGDDWGGYRKRAKAVDCVAMGFNIVVVGLFYGWNQALTASYEFFLACYVVTVVGFLAVALSVSELASFFPFAGGSFGYARCIISPTMGFLVGTTELFEYLLFVVAGVYTMGEFCTEVFHTSPDAEPLWWTIFFVFSAYAQVSGGQVLWTTMRVFLALTVAVILLFVVSVLPAANGPQYSPTVPPSSAQRNVVGFMEIFPNIAWVFFGIEGLVMTAEDVEQPTKTIPKALMACQVLLVVLITLGVVAATCSFPGSVALAEEPSALSAGFSHALGLDHSTSLLLSLPATFASPIGFLYAATKLMAAMASSRVLPSLLGRTYGRNRTPAVAVIVCSVLCYATLFIVRHVDPAHAMVVLKACMLNACFVYVSQAVCFFICKGRYDSMPRHFRSPLGAFGALLTAAVFGLIFVALAFFAHDYRHLTIFVAYTTVCGTYYWLVVRRFEFFSEEEVTTFMKAYVINANLRRKQEIKRRNHKRVVELTNSVRLRRTEKNMEVPSAGVVPSSSTGRSGPPRVLGAAVDVRAVE